MPLDINGSEANGGTENVKGTEIITENKSAEVLNHILEKLDSLNQSVDKLSIDTDLRFRDIEVERASRCYPSRTVTDAGAGYIPQQEDPPGFIPQSDTSEVQSEFQALKDSVNRIILPGSLTLGEASLPLKGEARGKINFIKKNANFVVTALKLLKTFGDKNRGFGH